MDPAYQNQMLLFVGAFVVGLALPPKWILWLAVAVGVAMLGYGVLRIASDPKESVFEGLVFAMALPIVGGQITFGGGLGMLLRWFISKILKIARLKSLDSIPSEDLAAHEAKIKRDMRDLF